MTKSEIIKAISEEAKLDRDTVGKVVNALFDKIQSTLTSGDEVTIKNFGVFKVLNKAERKGRNPKTGESITIPAYKLPHFRACEGFKRAVN